jgi:hypothetical protein
VVECLTFGNVLINELGGLQLCLERESTCMQAEMGQRES